MKNGGEKESGFFGKAKDQTSWWVIYPLGDEEGEKVCVQSFSDECQLAMFEVAEISYGYVKDPKEYKENKEHQYKLEKSATEGVWHLQSGHNGRYMANLPSGHCVL